MYIYGTSDLSNCFMHFDGEDDSGSAEEGYGEQVWPNQNGQQIEMDYLFRALIGLTIKHHSNSASLHYCSNISKVKINQTRECNCLYNSLHLSLIHI